MYVYPDSLHHVLCLSSQDGDGRPSEFATLLLQQYQSESKQFVEEIARALAEKRYKDIHQI